MGYIFRVSDLKKKIDSISKEGLEYVELDLFERDEIEGEVINATIEFCAIDDDEEIDFGGIEEINEENEK